MGKSSSQKKRHKRQRMGTGKKPGTRVAPYRESSGKANRLQAERTVRDVGFQ